MTMDDNEFIQYVRNCTEIFYDEPDPEAALRHAAALVARVAELEAFLGGDIQAVTADGQQHHIKRGDWRPLPPPPDAATTEAQP